MVIYLPGISPEIFQSEYTKPRRKLRLSVDTQSVVFVEKLILTLLGLFQESVLICLTS